MRWVPVVALAAVACAAAPAAPAEPAPTPTAAPATTRPAATRALPAAEPAALRIGTVEIDRPATGTVLVRPARTPVTFGRTELRGGSSYELTGDTCSGSTLRPADEGCRLEVTVLARGTGAVAARLVLPHNRGTLTVPVTAEVPLSYTVVLRVLGTGTVTGDQAGISCSGRCTARVAQGSTLTLTASGPVSWGGDCAGTAPTCRVPVAAPLEVTADFR